MDDLSEFIASGIIEAYVLGIASHEEVEELEERAATNVAVREAIDSFTSQVEKQLLADTLAPDPLIKPFLMASIDYMDRLKKGEQMVPVPSLDATSKLADFERWLTRPDFVLPDYFSGVYAKLIEHTPLVTSAIVWLKELAPEEVHHDEFEKFFIVEGTCEIIIEDKVYQLGAGDFLAIPLYKKHRVRVTSEIPCKAILQRVAA